MNNFVRSVLTLLLVIGMMAPAYAFDPFKGVERNVVMAEEHADLIISSSMPVEQKLFALKVCFVDQVQKVSVSDNFVNWLVEGISKAVGASPLVVQDSIPPNMENADIPEFLVKQLMNIQAMKRTQDEVVGAPKKPPVLYLGIKLTQEEVRRLTSSDDMINFVINHEDRIFYQLEK